MGRRIVLIFLQVIFDDSDRVEGGMTFQVDGCDALGNDYFLLL